MASAFLEVGAEPVVLDPGAITPVCTQDTPTVCVTKVHAAALASLSGSARDVLARLAQFPGAPTRADERPPGSPLPPGSIRVELGVGQDEDSAFQMGLLAINAAYVKRDCPAGGLAPARAHILR